MIKYKNNCVGCTSIGLPCMGDACSNKNIRIFYCDRCGEKMGPANKINGYHLCEECQSDMLDDVKED